MNRKYLVVIFSLLLPSMMFAQTFRHPYSFYGIGELQNQNSSNIQSIGGLAYGFSDSLSFSNANPASYSDIRFSIFDIGVKGKIQQLQQEQTNELTNYFSFSNVAFAFPISKKHNWALSFGLLPVSRIGYMNSSTFKSDTTTAIEKFDRQGGFNKFYLGSSISIIKNLSLGFNVSYVFGNNTMAHSLEFQKNTTYLNAKKILFKNYYGVGFDIGLLYKKSLKNDFQYSIGAAFSLPVNLSVNRETTAITYTAALDKDTIKFPAEVENNFSIPLTMGVGGILQKKNKWKAGFDFKYEKWSDFIPENKDFTLSDQWSFAVGGEYIPKFDENNYFQRIAYRGGIRYTNSFLKVDGEQFTKKSAVIGFGFPIYRNFSKSYINLGFEVGTMGKSSATLIKENFFNIYIGFQLNDIWFIKPKYY